MKYSLLTKYEIASRMTIKDLSEQEIKRRKRIRARVNIFFSGLDEFNKLSNKEKDKRIAICKL